MDVTDLNFLILSGVFQHVLFLYVDIFFMFVSFPQKCINVMGSYIHASSAKPVQIFMCAVGLTLKFVGHIYF